MAHRRRTSLIAALAVVAGFTACGGGSDDTQALELTHVRLAGLGEVPAGTRVVRTQRDWSALWETRSNPPRPGLVVPDVGETVFVDETD